MDQDFPPMPTLSAEIINRLNVLTIRGHAPADFEPAFSDEDDGGCHVEMAPKLEAVVYEDLLKYWKMGAIQFQSELQRQLFMADKRLDRIGVDPNPTAATLFKEFMRTQEGEDDDNSMDSDDGISIGDVDEYEQQFPRSSQQIGLPPPMGRIPKKAADRPASPPITHRRVLKDYAPTKPKPKRLAELAPPSIQPKSPWLFSGLGVRRRSRTPPKLPARAVHPNRLPREMIPREWKQQEQQQKQLPWHRRDPSPVQRRHASPERRWPQCPRRETTPRRRISPPRANRRRESPPRIIHRRIDPPSTQRRHRSPTPVQRHRTPPRAQQRQRTPDAPRRRQVKLPRVLPPGCTRSRSPIRRRPKVQTQSTSSSNHNPQLPTNRARRPKIRPPSPVSSLFLSIILIFCFCALSSASSSSNEKSFSELSIHAPPFHWPFLQNLQKRTDAPTSTTPSPYQDILSNMRANMPKGDEERKDHIKVHAEHFWQRYNQLQQGQPTSTFGPLPTTSVAQTSSTTSLTPTWSTTFSTSSSSTSKPSTMKTTRRTTTSTRPTSTSKRSTKPTTMTTTTTEATTIWHEIVLSKEEPETPYFQGLGQKEMVPEEPIAKSRKQSRDDWPSLTPSGKPALICSHRGGTLWTLKLGDQSPFCQPPPSLTAVWKNVTIHLYGQIIKPKEITSAFHCSAKRLAEEHYTNWLGDPINQDTTKEMLVVGRSACRKMADQKKCDFTNDQLTKEGPSKVWKTHQVLQKDFPGRFASFFSGAVPTVSINCLLQPAPLFFRPHNLQMISPILEVADCTYSSDYCLLSDNSSLIWDSNCPQGKCHGCDYEFLEFMRGEATSATEYATATFISKSREQALTFSANAKTVVACDGNKIVLSDQGFGILIEDLQKIRNNTTARQRRRVDEQQIAAQLTATQLATSRSLAQLYLKECQRNQRNDNPTLQARQLLQNDFVMARWISESAIEVFGCAPIELKDIALRSSKACYLFIPVSIRIKDHKYDAFLDPILRIVAANASIADCGIFRIHYLETQPGNWLKIDTSNGISTPMDNSCMHELHESLSEKLGHDMHLQPIIFHDWQLHNSSDFAIFAHISEFTRYQAWKEDRESSPQARADSINATPGGVKGFIEQWIHDFIESLVRRWIIISCFWASFLCLRDFLLPILLAYLFGPVWYTFRGMIGMPAQAPPTRPPLKSFLQGTHARHARRSRQRKAPRQQDNDDKLIEEEPAHIPLATLPSRSLTLSGGSTDRSSPRIMLSTKALRAQFKSNKSDPDLRGDQPFSAARPIRLPE